ncbi:hypothetical protein [Streptomyces sp. NPDC006132]|uniref:hypothetical protein n=1 Tax=Streptomyces sp. NPDC006132 TaxID=3156732 RepID=UPI0033F03160
MSWTRRPLTALAVGVLLVGAVGCGSGDAPGGEASPSPAGRLLEDQDKEGRPYREVEAEGAPDVGIEVQPDRGGGWEVRLTVRNFRFSPPGAAARAVAGRGLAHLYVDGRLVARLRAPEHRLPPGLVGHGTHHVTARLYADDGTVWAVDGRPVESTADITASKPGPGVRPSGAVRWGAGVPVVPGVGARPGVEAAVASGVAVGPGAGGPMASGGVARRGAEVPVLPGAVARQAAGAFVDAGVESGGRGSPGRAGKAS